MNDYITTFNQLFNTNLRVWHVVLLALWTLPWKGVALWRAARNRQSAWFVALLLVNSLAMLEIIYIFSFSKPKLNQIKGDA